MKPENSNSIILVVDDDPTNVHVLVDVLSHEGFNVSVAMSGDEALDQIETIKPDIILLDVVMPGIDGFETCRRLKANTATADIPVIFMTALADTLNTVTGFEVGGVDYIAKPLQHEEVLARLNSQLTIVHQQRRLRKVNASLDAERTSLNERVQERTAELSCALRLKDEFLRTMSHELRTPLNVILGMSEVLQDNSCGPLNDRQRKYLGSIEENGRRLLALLIDILDFSQIMAGNVKLDIVATTLEPLCQATLQRINKQARKKQIQLSFRFDTDITTVQADGFRLQQMLDKLLDNAVKFTAEGGTIGLDIDGDRENQAVHFSVWDTGIGIAKKDLERLFQPFVQLDASLSRNYEGTGIGLALAQRLAELHGGNIGVESDVGQGSRFTVSLPWKEA